jgi:hypothetical protein
LVGGLSRIWITRKKLEDFSAARQNTLKGREAGMRLACEGQRGYFPNGVEAVTGTRRIPLGLWS